MMRQGTSILVFWASWCKGRGLREGGHSEIHKKIYVADKAELGCNAGSDENKLKREIRMRCSRKLYSTQGVWTLSKGNEEPLNESGREV